MPVLQGSTFVELHWRLFENPHFFNLDPANLIAHAVLSPAGEHDVPVLPDSYLLLYLMCHAATHHYTTLKQLCDLHWLVQKLSENILRDTRQMAHTLRLDNSYTLASNMLATVYECSSDTTKLGSDAIGERPGMVRDALDRLSMSELADAARASWNLKKGILAMQYRVQMADGFGYKSFELCKPLWVMFRN